MLKIVVLPLLLLLLLLLLSVVLTGALASVEQAHSDEASTTLLTRGRELVEKSMTIWWLSPILSVVFILSMHVWVYGIVHVVWYIMSLLTSRIHVKKN